MLTIGLFGIASSLLTEVITWLNKKLISTPLEGMGSFIVVFALSFVGAAIKILWMDHVALTWTSLMAVGSQIFAIAEIYFVFIASKFGLTVKHE